MKPAISPHGHPGEESSPSEREEQALARQIIRASRNVIGITFGLLCGVGLFLATNILVLKGGPNVGMHLSLLNQFFPGYSVTFTGSFLGLFYGFVFGYVNGWIVATVYNKVAFFGQDGKR